MDGGQVRKLEMEETRSCLRRNPVLPARKNEAGNRGPESCTAVKEEGSDGDGREDAQEDWKGLTDD
jgi:hypothetical protein